MGPGTFFKRIKEFSDVKGVQKFEYLGIVLTFDGEEDQYPIKVFFDEEHISFDYSAVHYIKSEEEKSSKLFHKHLFYLPLTYKNTNHSDLWTVLLECFHDTTVESEIMENESEYFKTKDKDKESELYNNKIYEPRPCLYSQDDALWVKDPFYIDFSIFFWRDYFLNTPLNDENKIVHKVLLLDFLFDINHSEVFQVYLEFDTVFGKLLENKLFTGILLKNEYKYHEKLKTEAKKEGREYDNTKYELERLKAQKKWLDFIIADKEEETINENNYWFSSSEEEYKTAYIRDFINLTTKK